MNYFIFIWLIFFCGGEYAANAFHPEFLLGQLRKPIPSFHIDDNQSLDESKLQAKSRTCSFNELQNQGLIQIVGNQEDPMNNQVFANSFRGCSSDKAPMDHRQESLESFLGPCPFNKHSVVSLDEGCFRECKNLQPSPENQTLRNMASFLGPMRFRSIRTTALLKNTRPANTRSANSGSLEDGLNTTDTNVEHQLPMLGPPNAGGSAIEHMEGSIETAGESVPEIVATDTLTDVPEDAGNIVTKVPFEGINPLGAPRTKSIATDQACPATYGTATKELDPIAQFGRKALDTIAYFAKIITRASEGDIHNQLSLASEGDTHQGHSSITIGYKERLKHPPPEQKSYHSQSSRQIDQFCVQRADITASFRVQPSSFSFCEHQHSAARLRGRVLCTLHSTEAKRRGYQLTMLGHHVGHHARDFMSMADLQDQVYELVLRKYQLTYIWYIASSLQLARQLAARTLRVQNAQQEVFTVVQRTKMHIGHFMIILLAWSIFTYLTIMLTINSSAAVIYFPRSANAMIQSGISAQDRPKDSHLESFLHHVWNVLFMLLVCEGVCGKLKNATMKITPSQPRTSASENSTLYFGNLLKDLLKFSRFRGSVRKKANLNICKVFLF